MSLFGSGGTPGGFSFGAAAAPASTNASTGFSFAAASAASTAPSTGFSLGASSTPSTGFSFGSAAPATAAAPTGGFSLGSTATPAASTGGFSFGAAASTGGVLQLGAAPTASAAPTFKLGGAAPAPAATGFSFSGLASQASATSAPTIGLGAATALTTASSFSFAAKPASTAPVAAPAATSFSFGTPKATQSSTGSLFTSTATAAVAPTVAATAVPALSFGSAATAASTAIAAAPASTGFSFKSATTAAKTSAAPTLTTGLTAQPAAVTAPAKQMSYKELEETVEKWLHDLGEQEKAFLSQAVQVNTWDKQLIENGEKVTELNNEVERVKADQQRLDRELDFILSQQEELEELLTPIEAQVKSQQQQQHVQHSDVERERTYNLAENIDAQMKRMMEDLREIIERINNSNVTPNQGTDETMLQIGKILNSHMDSLQWIDQNTNQLQKRVGDVNQIMESRRVEHDRTFHLSYDRE